MNFDWSDASGRDFLEPVMDQVEITIISRMLGIRPTTTTITTTTTTNATTTTTTNNNTNTTNTTYNSKT